MSPLRRSGTSRTLAVRVGLCVTRALFGVVAAAALAQASGAETSPEERFSKAIEYLEDDRFSEAIPLLESVRESHPSDPAVLWNLGIASAATGRDASALEYWRLYRTVQPDDWRGIAKLVQTHQALGDLKARDRERDALFAFRRDSPDPAVKGLDRYCREQGMLGGRRVFVFEYFEPSGPMAVYYDFSFVDLAGIREFRITLGSYDFTNQIAHETGELPPDQRLFHLDKYFERGHALITFFHGRPSY